MKRETITTGFREIPVIGDKPLFQVAPGVPIGIALSEAACLADSLREMALQGVQDGIDETRAYLMEVVADAIGALCSACERGPDDAKGDGGKQ